MRALVLIFLLSCCAPVKHNKYNPSHEQQVKAKKKKKHIGNLLIIGFVGGMMLYFNLKDK